MRLMEAKALLGVLVAVLVYIGLMWAIVRWVRARLYARARSAADALAGAGARIGEVSRSTGLRKPAVVEFELDGTKAKFEVLQYSRDWILQGLRIETQPLPPMLIRDERSLDRLGKSLGLNREVQLGDPPFDNAAYIATAVPDAVVREALGSAEVRARVLDLLRTGYRLEMGANGLRALRIRGFWASFEAPEVTTVLRHLAAIRQALPRLDAATLVQPRLSRVSWPVVASFGVLLAGIVAIAAIPSAHPPLSSKHGLAALGFGIAGWVAVVAAVGFALRHRPYGIQELLWSAVTLLFGVPPLVAIGLFVLNAELDHGPAVTHAAHVKALHHRDGEIDFAPPEPGSQAGSVGVSRAAFGTFHVGDTIEIAVRAGALGWPWSEDVRRIEASAPRSAP